MTHRTRFTVIALPLVALVFAACNGNAAPIASGTPGATIRPVGVAAAEPATAGEVAGAELALVIYTDAAQGFTLARPATWTQDKSVSQGVKFNGSNDSLTLQFITPPAGTTTLAYAQSDGAALTAAFPGFKQVGLAPSAEVNNSVLLGFTASGTSAVTGKTYQARADRYYMPIAGGRLAILTVIGPTQNYDQQGVRDIALSFRLTK